MVDFATRELSYADENLHNDPTRDFLKGKAFSLESFLYLLISWLFSRIGFTLTLEYWRLVFLIEVGVTVLRYLLLDILVILNPRFLLSCFTFRAGYYLVYYFISDTNFCKTHLGLYSLWETFISMVYFGPLKVPVISCICCKPIISSLFEYKNITGTLEFISIRFKSFSFNPCSYSILFANASATIPAINYGNRTILHTSSLAILLKELKGESAMIYFTACIIVSSPHSCRVLKQVTAPIDLPQSTMFLYPFSTNLLKIYTKLPNRYTAIPPPTDHK